MITFLIEINGVVKNRARLGHIFWQMCVYTESVGEDDIDVILTTFADQSCDVFATVDSISEGANRTRR